MNLFRGSTARMKRISHGAMAGKYDQRSDSGPSGSNNHRGTFQSTPGIDIGVTEDALSAPALPKEAP